jgi:hypothetical protein
VESHLGVPKQRPASDSVILGRHVEHLSIRGEEKLLSRVCFDPGRIYSYESDLLTFLDIVNTQATVDTKAEEHIAVLCKRETNKFD